MSLLYSLQATGKVRLKKLDEPGNVYQLKMSGLGDDIVWFLDRPERGAGRASLTDFITGWDSDFFDSNPNSALTYRENGKPDTIVFEQFKPQYNKKRDILTSKILVHESQALDGISEDERSSLGYLANEARGSDNSKFDKKFEGASLFIDSAVKWTRVSFVNNTNSDMVFIRADSASAKPNYLKLAQGLAFTGVAVMGAIASMVPVIGPAAAYGAWSSLAAGLVSLTEFVASAGSDGVEPKDKDSSYVLKPGERATFIDTDTRFGYDNGVRDINQLPSLRSPDGTKVLPLGLAQFDNPAIGKPKAYFADPLYGSSSRVIYDSGKPGKNTFQSGVVPTVSPTVEYFGYQQAEDGWTYPTWDISFDGNVVW